MNPGKRNPLNSPGSWEIPRIPSLESREPGKMAKKLPGSQDILMKALSKSFQPLIKVTIKAALMPKARSALRPSYFLISVNPGKHDPIDSPGSQEIPGVKSLESQDPGKMAQKHRDPRILGSWDISHLHEGPKLYHLQPERSWHWFPWFEILLSK